MRSTDPQAARLLLATAAAVILLAGTSGFWLGRWTAPAPPPPPPRLATPAEAPPPRAARTLVPPPLGRSDLVRAASAAAAAYAAGLPQPIELRDLVGRRFETRLAFGCSGAAAAAPAAADRAPDAPGAQTLQWSLDAKGEAVKLTARPAVWTQWPLLKAIEPEPFEAVEGFWVSHPWIEGEGCPAPREAAADYVPQVRETLGLAQFFPAGASRIGRGGRGYEVVRKLPPGVETGARDFSLALAGRIAGYPDGRPVHCASASPEERPICLVAVEFDRVAFEDPRTGSVLGVWPR